jgi:hypothetical protein
MNASPHPLARSSATSFAVLARAVQSLSVAKILRVRIAREVDHARLSSSPSYRPRARRDTSRQQATQPEYYMGTSSKMFSTLLSPHPGK